MRDCARGQPAGAARATERKLRHAAGGPPPYCSGGATRSDRKAGTSTKYQQSGSAPLSEFAGDARDERSFRLWSTLWMCEALRILEPGSSAVVFSDWRQQANTQDAVQAAGFVFRGIVVWVKPAARPQPNSF